MADGPDNFKTPEPSPERQAEMDAAFRELGRYVYEFSWLCWGLKWNVTAFTGGTTYEALEIVTAEMTAAPLTNACFALCEKVARDEEEVKLIKRLRGQVIGEISRRNDLMHGDWMIGWTSTTGVDNPDGTSEQLSQDMPPKLTRVKPGRSSAEKKTEEELPLDDLAAEADRMRDLRRTVEDFLRTAQGRAFVMPEADATHVEIVGLADVWVIEEGIVTRNGPRAGEVPAIWMH